MRALTLILLTALIALWCHFALSVAPTPTGPLATVEETTAEVSAATLNNDAVALAQKGRNADALAYLERARDFRPDDAAIAANLSRVRARLEQRGWRIWLGLSTAATVLLLGVGWIWRGLRAARDRLRLARLRVRGDSWLRIEKNAKREELPLRFTAPVDGLIKRHPLTIVWSSARHGKHMKSRPPVEANGKRCTVKLDQDRLERLRRYPGDWKGFLYLGKTPVGEAFARVG